jgi:hypothetical protein
MPREDWRDVEEERRWRLRDREPYADRDPDDYGQADYSNLYGYDPRSRSGYPMFNDGRPERSGERPDYAPVERPSRWDYEHERRRARRDGPSDRVLWTVIMERLDQQRRLDLHDVDVEVRDAEVTLNGTVRHKADKRRIEDVADIDGVRNVQNNLRVRGSRWTFL